MKANSCVCRLEVKEEKLVGGGAFRFANLLKRDFNTVVFLWILRSAFFIEQLRWLLLTRLATFCIFSSAGSDIGRSVYFCTISLHIQEAFYIRSAFSIHLYTKWSLFSSFFLTLLPLHKMYTLINNKQHEFKGTIIQVI